MVGRRDLDLGVVSLADLKGGELSGMGWRKDGDGIEKGRRRRGRREEPRGGEQRQSG